MCLISIKYVQHRMCKGMVSVQRNLHTNVRAQSVRNGILTACRKYDVATRVFMVVRICTAIHNGEINKNKNETTGTDLVLTHAY